MSSESSVDYEKLIEKYSENFDKALDAICPVKGGGDDKRKFFIEGICECVGVGFDIDRFHQEESDKIDPKKWDLSFERYESQQEKSDFIDENEDMEAQAKGVISKSQRQDGKGIHVVSQSIAGQSGSNYPQGTQATSKNEEGTI